MIKKSVLKIGVEGRQIKHIKNIKKNLYFLFFYYKKLIDHKFNLIYKLFKNKPSINK